MDIPVEARRLLTEAAMLACLLNDTGRARRTLAGLDAAAPGLPSTEVGYALAALTDGDADAAVGRLRPLAEAGVPEAAVLLAVALRAAGRLAETDALVASHAGANPALSAIAASLR